MGRRFQMTRKRIFCKLAVLCILLLLSGCQKKENVSDCQMEIPKENEVTSVEIDDTLDSFFVDTKGKLGTLLVTVKKDVENSQQGYDFLLHFTVWDPKHMDVPLQTMEANSSVFRWSDVRDADFDGYQDFGYMYAMGNQPQYWHFWIWDEDKGQFREEAEFDQISCPEFCEETKTIHGWARSSAMGSGEVTIHQWVDGKLVCMRRISIDWDSQNECFTLIVVDQIDHKLVEVYRNTFPSDSTEHLDVSMKWQDLEYHGEI